MEATGTSKVSSRGQVVIPQKVRRAIGLKEGEFLFVFGHDDTIVLKRVHMPTLDDLEPVFKRARQWANEVGLTREDVDRAIQEDRAKGRRSRS